MENNQLTQLKTMSIVVADSGDINAIKAFTPEDCTTNPSLVLKAAQQQEYASLVEEVIQHVQKDSSIAEQDKLELTLDSLAVAFGEKLTQIVPGVVSTEVDAHLSFDCKAMVNKARHLIQLYAKRGVQKERVLIKLAATWEGIQAAEILEKEGIRCNMTLIFSVEQALACAQVGAYLISPFVGRITDWYKKAQGVAEFAPNEDPGVLSVRTIYQHLKQKNFATIVMGASFRSITQITALAGCDRLTISTALLAELQNQEGHIDRVLSAEMAKSVPLPEIDTKESHFRWALNENAMAHEKLAEGIRLFHQDYMKLRQFIQQF